MISIEDDNREEEREMRPQRNIVLIVGTAGEGNLKRALENHIEQYPHLVMKYNPKEGIPLKEFQKTIDEVLKSKEQPIDMGNPFIYKANPTYPPEPKYDKPKSKFHK